MLSRCGNPKDKSFHLYGAHGIYVDPSWFRYEQFVSDMGRRPGTGKQFSIDRIDNSGPYSKDNCRWADPSTQAINRGMTVMLTVRGETMSLFQWSKKTGIPHARIQARIKRGWNHESAIFESPDVHKKKSQFLK